MLKRIGTLLFLTFFCLQGFAAPQEYRGVWQRKPHSDKQQPKRLTRRLPPVDSVFIKGGISLEIIGNQPVSKIAAKKNYEGLAVTVFKGSIYISNSKPVACHQNPRPVLRLSINSLRRLVIAGDSIVNVRNVNTSCGLQIEHCGSGLVYIHGPTCLANIVSSGNATICIPFVMSPQVNIIASRKTEIKLRGQTPLLMVRAFDDAVVDTRFMCVDKALIQAADWSLVTVRAIRSLHAFASGMSNVYYYSRPYELLQHQALSGNVLQMGC